MENEASAGSERQTGRLKFTARRPNRPTSIELGVSFRIPGRPNRKPHAVKTMVLRYHPGTVIDTSARPRCRASDAELIARGAAACPQRSRVATGILVTDTGSRAVIPRIVRNRLTSFNNRGEVINLAESDNPRTRVVSRGKLRSNTLRFEIAPVPGNPPPDPYTAFKRIRASGVGPLVRGGKAYARTPPRCPRSGRWNNRLTFVYRDGVRQTLVSRSRCRRG